MNNYNKSNREFFRQQIAVSGKVDGGGVLNPALVLQDHCPFKMSLEKLSLKSRSNDVRSLLLSDPMFQVTPGVVAGLNIQDGSVVVVAESQSKNYVAQTGNNPERVVYTTSKTFFEKLAC